MARARQQEFKGEGFRRTKDCFGGTYLKNSHAKTARPLSSKLPVHLVLRTVKTSGDHSLGHPRHFDRVNACVRLTARKHGIRIYEYANVGNHMHLLIKLRSVHGWKAFIRELTGRIAQLIQNRKPQQKAFKLWAQRPFTRLVKGWRRAYRLVRDYVLLNHLQGEGLISRIEIRLPRLAPSG